MDDNKITEKTGEYISSGDAAALYGVTHDHISRLCRQKKIHGRLQGGIWLIEKKSVAEFFTEKRCGAPGRNRTYDLCLIRTAFYH